MTSQNATEPSRTDAITIRVHRYERGEPLYFLRPDAEKTGEQTLYGTCDLPTDFGAFDLERVRTYLTQVVDGRRSSKPAEEPIATLQFSPDKDELLEVEVSETYIASEHDPNLVVAGIKTALDKSNGTGGDEE